MKTWHVVAFALLAFCIVAVAFATRLLAARNGSSNGNPAGSRKPSPFWVFDASPPFRPAEGGFNVASEDSITLYDNTRDKELIVRVSYPDHEGGFPVIVFSHGGGGSKDGYTKLTEYLASYGYVVIQPTHADSVSLVPRRKQARRLIEVIRTVDTDEAGWKNRAADVSFILDSLTTIERDVPNLKGKIDESHIGMAGHSYGAYTTQIIGGATPYPENAPNGLVLKDDRVDALLMLSPQGTGQMGLVEKSWRNLTLPAMFVTGTYDKGMKKQDTEWRKEAFYGSPAGDKYLLFIEGAYHNSFSGSLVDDAGKMLAYDELSRFDKWMIDKHAGKESEYALTDQTAVWRVTKDVALAFFDAYLKDSKDAQDFLSEQSAKTRYGEYATLTTK